MADLRLRVFAGPNGSGKSTVIDKVRNFQQNGKPIEFGHYINADDIGAQLKKAGKFSIVDFDIISDSEDFAQVALASGLIREGFTEDIFYSCWQFEFPSFSYILEDKQYIDNVSQIIADFLRKKLLIDKKRFSFETVFSHPSKIDIMKEAKDLGYKVYLYFVSTESPEINKFRVKARKAKGGHDVTPDKIESRYYRSLDLLHEAAQISYQTYFIDNSRDGEDANIFAHFKVIGDKKEWDAIDMEKVPGWFIKYYSDKNK
ncbi:hypothetical protein [Flavobacterium sp.]|uniref:hypothetical protein n=1 Tax=Flavobacterium sp. TaxID=239 RepID=UPI0040339D7E